MHTTLGLKKRRLEILNQHSSSRSCATINSTSENGRISQTGIQLERSILNREHPLDTARREYPSYEHYALKVDLQRSNTFKELFSAESTDQEVKQKFDDVLSKTIERARAPPRSNFS